VILAFACALAVITYILRVGFASASTKLEQLYGLDEQAIGWLMASFMVAYGAFEVPWGSAADRRGVRGVLVAVALGASITTALAALVNRLPAWLGGVFVGLLILRFAFGAFQAGTFPAIARMLSGWLPAAERGGAQGAVWMSSRLGGALAPWVIATLAGPKAGWASSLVLAAGFGVLWCLFYWPIFRNRPEESRFVNEEELRLIESQRATGHGDSHGRIPWGRLLANPSVLALCGMYGCLGYSGNFFLTMLPKYLTNQRALGESWVLWLTALPFAGGVASCLLGGVLSDLLIRKFGKRRWGRPLVGGIGLSIAGCSIAASLLAREPIGLAVLLCLTFIGNDLAMGPAWAAASEIGRERTGVVSGLMNMTASFAAAIQAVITGTLLKQTGDTLPFLLLGAVYLCGAGFWLKVDITRPFESKASQNA
jgi:sugar phosphate permease